MVNKVTIWFWKGILKGLMKIFPYQRIRIEEYMGMIEKYQGKKKLKGGILQNKSD